MIEWYLNLTEEPQIGIELVSYLNNLKPHKAVQWNYTAKKMCYFKEKLINECIRIQNNRCVYCGLSFTRRLIDREHFVSKAQKNGNPEFMFHTKNLFASCAYCNRRIKGQKKVLAKYDKEYDKCEFNIIHPLLDNSNDYLLYKEDSKGRKLIIEAKSSPNKKGEKTIQYFELATIEMRKARKGYLAEIEDEDEDLALAQTPKTRAKKAVSYRPS